MATSIMPRTMASLSLGLLLLVALVSGQSVQPSNASLPATESVFTQLTITGATSLSPSVFNIAPLTEQVGLGGNANAVSAPTFSGNIQPIDSFNQNNVSQGDISFISCDPNVQSSNIDPSSVVQTVGKAQPQGIILYSTTSQECTLSGNSQYSTIYTMTSAQNSNALLQALQSKTLHGRVASNSTTSASGSGASPTSNDGGPAPTTAVAMSILYSITGIITLLFLVIIATGAIRAHRHPERYGPRTGLSGRTRQSRAKGLARAMLETLPIVKFGDPEPPKPASRDIELADGASSGPNITDADGTAIPAATESEATTSATPAVPDEKSGSASAQAESVHSGHAPVKKEGELGCSICTEDFTTGEDVRVLPCNHKYHPACIDPWLLNVSGTCPLCRHDLRPATTEAPEGAAPTAEGSELPPPLNPEEGTEVTAEGDEALTSPQPRRGSRFLDLNRLRHAPADERIAALRSLREQTQRDGEAEDVEEPSRRARLTGRLRDTFRIRTRTAAQE